MSKPRIRWPRPSRRREVPSAYIKRGYIPTHGVGVIEGLMADIAGTEPERIVAGWLEAHDIPYDFQLPLLGGRLVAGGIVVDFVLYVAPGPVVLCVNSWWHRWPERAELDAIQRAIIEQNIGWRVEEIWEEDIYDWRRLDARMREIITGWRPLVGGLGPGMRRRIPACCDDPSHWEWYG